MQILTAWAWLEAKGASASCSKRRSYLPVNVRLNTYMRRRHAAQKQSRAKQGTLALQVWGARVPALAAATDVPPAMVGRGTYMGRRRAA